MIEVEGARRTTRNEGVGTAHLTTKGTIRFNVDKGELVHYQLRMDGWMGIRSKEEARDRSCPKVSPRAHRTHAAAILDISLRKVAPDPGKRGKIPGETKKAKKPVTRTNS